MSVPDERTGKSKRELYEEIAKQTGIVAPELMNLPSVPVETAHIWRWFIDLGRARTAGWSADPITWDSAWAYFNLLGFRPETWELSALRAVDDEYLASRSAPRKKTVRGAGDLRRNLNQPDPLGAL